PSRNIDPLVRTATRSRRCGILGNFIKVSLRRSWTGDAVRSGRAVALRVRLQGGSTVAEGPAEAGPSVEIVYCESAGEAIAAEGHVPRGTGAPQVRNEAMRHEIIDGEHHVTPSPNPTHQRICGNLMFALRSYLQTHPSGELFTPLLDVVLSDSDIVQPDL